MTRELILPFDTDDPTFVRGVEVGMVHVALAMGAELPYSVTMHATNCEMALRLAETHGIQCSSVDLNDDFVEVTFDDRAR